MPSIPYIWYKISLATNNREQGEEFMITLGTMSGELSDRQMSSEFNLMLAQL